MLFEEYVNNQMEKQTESMIKFIFIILGIGGCIFHKLNGSTDFLNSIIIYFIMYCFFVKIFYCFATVLTILNIIIGRLPFYFVDSGIRVIALVISLYLIKKIPINIVDFMIEVFKELPVK